MTSPPKLPLSNAQISEFFSQPTPQSAKHLASLINSQSDSGTLDPILDTTIRQLLLSSFAQRTQIDNLVSFLSSAATEIESSVSNQGESIAAEHKSIALSPSSGPGVLIERLSYILYNSLWDYISRACTPDEVCDKELSKKYYVDTFVHATVLSRAFATQPFFRDQLWRDIEDIFVKGLFSGPNQEPGVFIALSALLLGAGVEIREYLSQEGKVGQGKSWLWYDDVRTSDEVTWGWNDIVESLKKQPGTEISSCLPHFVKASFEVCKRHVGEGSGELKSWDSQNLAGEAFSWVNEQ